MEEKDLGPLPEGQITFSDRRRCALLARDEVIRNETENVDDLSEFVKSRGVVVRESKE